MRAGAGARSRRRPGTPSRLLRRPLVERLAGGGAGLVAISMVNAMAVVAPAGGREALHGTNPIAVAVPGDPDPAIVDMRTNVFQDGRLLAEHPHRRPAPAGQRARAKRRFARHRRRPSSTTPCTCRWQAGRATGWARRRRPHGRARGKPDRARGGLGNGTRRPRGVLPRDSTRRSSADPARFADGVRRLAEQARATLPVDEGSPVRLAGRARRGRAQVHGGGTAFRSTPALWALLESSGLAALDVGAAAPAASLRSSTARAEPSSARDRRAPRGSARRAPCDPTRRPR